MHRHERLKLVFPEQYGISQNNEVEDDPLTPHTQGKGDLEIVEMVLFGKPLLIV